MTDDRQPVLPAVPGYRLLRELHRGGQGIVYEAEQLDPERTVAIKVLTEGLLANEAARRRFEREVEIAATLDHPGIVQVLGTGDCTEGRYLVMPLVTGQDLGDWLRKDEPSLARRVEVFLEVCDAVSHAHRRGIIHRDLKPANVRINADGRPVVLDFGLAKPLEASATLTRTGVFAGTFGYASPEQLGGDSRSLDTRSDVYSLCALLHEMLCGEPPFPEATDLATAISAVLQLDPKGPASRAGGVPADLDAIVLKGLAKDRDHRYATVDALVEDVQRHLDGEPVRARRDNRWYVLSRSLARHRVLLVASFLVVGLIASGFVLVLGERDKALEAQASAEAASEQAAEELAVSNTITDYLMKVFARTHEGGRELTAREMLAKAGDRATKEFGDDPEVEMAVLQRLSRTQKAAGNLAESVRLARAALEIADTLHDEWHPDHVQLYKLLAASLYGQHDWEAAAALTQHALEIQQEIGPDDKHLMFGLWHNLGGMVAEADPERARRCWQSASELLDDEIDPSGNRGLMIRTNLGELASQQGDHVESERIHREVLGLRSAKGDSPAQLMVATAYLVSALEAQGRFAEAESEQRRALRNLVEYYQQPEAEVGQRRAELAGLIAAQGRHDEALEVLALAESEIVSAGGPVDRKLAEVHRRRPDVLAAAGRLAEAHAAHEAALAWYREAFGPDHPATGEATLRAARYAVQTRSEGEAVELARGALGLLAVDAERYRDEITEAEELLASLGAQAVSEAGTD